MVGEGSDLLVVVVLVVQYGLDELLGGSDIGIFVEIAFCTTFVVAADNVIKSNGVDSIEDGLYSL